MPGKIIGMDNIAMPVMRHDASFPNWQVVQERLNQDNLKMLL